ALDWSAEHPGNKLFFDVGFLPKIDLLRALPRLEDLQITTPIRCARLHPGNKLFFDVGFLPKIDLLRALPRLEDLQITTPIRYRIGFSDQYDRTTEISADLFFELLGAHQNVHLDNVALTPGELDRTLQTIEEDPTERLIHLGVKRSMLAKWMNGISTLESSLDEGSFDLLDDLL
ncbi:hypothetical protein PRIPAC_86596, partial [Pristionchus pacificus]|uniref:Uncharacterized protein n=1 Tax=Pristionchus pacificus TaxID=54126 RepID=H3E3A4_PRIPA